MSSIEYCPQSPQNMALFNSHFTPSQTKEEECEVFFIIIIITIQGLAGSWGQDTDQAATFWGVFKVRL